MLHGKLANLGFGIFSQKYSSDASSILMESPSLESVVSRFSKSVNDSMEHSVTLGRGSIKLLGDLPKCSGCVNTSTESFVKIGKWSVEFCSMQNIASQTWNLSLGFLHAQSLACVDS